MLGTAKLCLHHIEGEMRSDLQTCPLVFALLSFHIIDPVFLNSLLGSLPAALRKLLVPSALTIDVCGISA